MTELLSRHRQILTILHTEGRAMSNREILGLDQIMRGNELPNDGTQMALNTLALRRRGLLTTDDTCYGEIHRITPKGIAALAETNGEIITETPPPDGAPHPDMADDMPAQKTLIAEFDEALAIIRACIVNADAPVKIADKTKKINLLEQLETSPFMNTYAAVLIASIRRDIEQIDEA